MRNSTNLVYALAVVVSLALGSMAQRLQPSGRNLYTIVNDDEPIGETGNFNSGSVFVNGQYQTKISTGSYGVGGAYLGIHSVDIDVVSSRQQCIFIADPGGVSGSGPGDIYAYNAATRTGTRVVSAFGYNGTLYGIGIVHRGNLLVASWAGSGELETFTINSDCSITSNQSSANGLGLGDGNVDQIEIAPNGDYVVATYADNSYGVYALSNGSIGEPAQYIANCSKPNFFGEPVAIAISPDSSTVYLDCVYGENGALIDAFTAANPSVTVTNGPLIAAGGTPINGSVTMGLSPDGKVLYIVGTFSGAIESANVSGTSVNADSCSNLLLPGYNSQWIYPGTVDVIGSGAGQGLAIPETAFGHTPDSYLELVRIDGNHCLHAVSQGTDRNSLHALSGDSYLR